jgi:membrane protein
MERMRSSFAHRLETARRRVEAAPEDGKPEKRPGWGGVLKALLALWVARAAQRVFERQAELPEAGSKGGEASAAAVARPVAVPRSPTAPVEKEQAKEPEQADEVPTPRSGPWAIAKFVLKEFGKDNGTLMAAAVAFYLLLSVIPLILVAISLLGYVLGSSNEAVNQVFAFLNHLFPVDKKKIHEMIQGIIDEKVGVGVVGMAGLAVTATGGFATLENAINAMWNRPNRSFLMNKVFAFAMMLVVGALFAVSLGITALVRWAGNIPGFDWLASNWMPQALGYVLPVVITGLMFSVIYRFYPNGRTGWKSSLTSGFITAVFWEVFKIAYTFYTSHGDKSIYGVVVGLVMWIFYSAALVLFGSELTWVLEGCPGREGKDQVQAQRGR